MVPRRRGPSYAAVLCWFFLAVVGLMALAIAFPGGGH